MPTYNTAAIKASIDTVKNDHPDLYGLLVELGDELESCYIDSDSTIAPCATALVEALKG